MAKVVASDNAISAHTIYRLTSIKDGLRAKWVIISMAPYLLLHRLSAPISFPLRFVFN